MSNLTSKKAIAEKKVKAVILSCKTTQQFDLARVYLDLFHERYQDSVLYAKLWSLWKKTIFI